MIENTINTEEFNAMDRELKFYKVMVNYGSSYSRYISYFDDGTYPLVAVLRMDGSVYGHYGHRTTDFKNVTPGVRSLIEKLSAEQNGDGSVVAPVETIQPTQSSMSAADWGAKLKGKVNGILFDGNQEICGSFVLSISAKGKVSAKFTMMSGRTTIKGQLNVKDDVPQFAEGSLSLAYDSATQVWSGSWGDYGAYASILSPSAFAGLYTAPAANASNSGYATLTLKNGKGKIAGMVGGKNKVSVNGAAVVLPAAIVAERLARWDFGVDTAFVPAVKAGKFSGGAAVGADGRMYVSFSAFGGAWSGAGAMWPTTTNLGALAGKVLRITTGAGVFEVPILSVNGRKVELGANDISAKVSVAEKKGTFKGKVNISGAKYSFEGALVKDGGSVLGKGLSYGAGVHLVEIVDPLK